LNYLIFFWFFVFFRSTHGLGVSEQQQYSPNLAPLHHSSTIAYRSLLHIVHQCLLLGLLRTVFALLHNGELNALALGKGDR